MSLKTYLDSKASLFYAGGKYEKFYPLYEAVDTFIYMPGERTKSCSHIRDGIDLKRVMITVWVATFPAMFFGMWNLGYHANTYIGSVGIEAINTDWHEVLISLLAGHNPQSLWDNLWYGACYYLPIYVVTFIVGGFFEILFAVIRKHEINEGFFVTSVLFSLTCPPDLPLIYVALGIAFGIVIGKELFGGTGKNFLNPALTGRAFLYLAYPASMSGSEVWVAVDGLTQATPLGVASVEGLAGVIAQYNWKDAFFGVIPGSIGETSTLAVILGGMILLVMRIASWRIVFGCLLGMIVFTTLLNIVGSDDNLMFSMPWYWHLVLGGYMFGILFMATDPVSSSMTNQGKWIFGILVGMMTVLIRVINPAFPEGVMFAILFANLCAPTIDYMVEQAHIRRRKKRVE